jgi:hypothetical protein
MRVQFLRDFQGVASREQFYPAGTVVDLPGEVVHALQREAVVRVVDVPPPAVESAKPARATKRAAKRSQP